MKGRHSEESKRKIREARARQVITETTKQKIRETILRKGIKPPVGSHKGFKHSEETKQKIREKRAKQVFTEEQKQKQREAVRKRLLKNNPQAFKKGSKINLGRRLTDEEKKVLSLAHIGLHTGAKHWNWKGGITPEMERLRKSLEYKQWRKAVFERDNYTCQSCGVHSSMGKAVYLHAHHTKLFSKYSKFRYDISNGVTLCSVCHNMLHNLLKKAK